MRLYIRPSCNEPWMRRPNEAALVIEVTDQEDYTCESEIPLKDLAEALKPYLESQRNDSHNLQPDGNPCSVCGDNGHQAFECHHNPAYVMKWKESLEKRANELHDEIHQDQYLLRESDTVGKLHEFLHQIIGVYRK